MTPCPMNLQTAETGLLPHTLSLVGLPQASPRRGASPFDRPSAKTRASRPYTIPAALAQGTKITPVICSAAFWFTEAPPRLSRGRDGHTRGSALLSTGGLYNPQIRGQITKGLIKARQCKLDYSGSRPSSTSTGDSRLVHPVRKSPGIRSTIVHSPGITNMQPQAPSRLQAPEPDTTPAALAQAKRITEVTRSAASWLTEALPRLR
jgi:hypothetical protein